MKKHFLFCVLTLIFLSVSAQYTTKVNPFVGTDEHGHTYPGAIAPFGMVQLSADTRLSGWDGCSGYHYSDSVIYGFSHTHLSGTGCEDLCDILFSPECKYTEKICNHSFSHSNERAYAGYYSVKLNDGIFCELTATERAGYHRYTYPQETKNIFFIIDMLHRDKTLEWNVEVLDDNTVVGYRDSKSWAEEQKVFFAARFNKPIEYSHVDKENGRLYLSFSAENKVLEVKVALSSTDYLGALKNLGQEKTKSCVIISLAIIIGGLK